MSDTSAVTEELERALAAEEGGKRWIRRGVTALVIVAVLAGGLVYRATHRPPAAAKYVSQQVTSGDVAEKVMATGAVQPVLQVNVGSQVNGRVTRVLVDFNSTVKRGDVLAEIDPSLYGAQVNQQEANLAAQRAQAASVQANAETLRIQYERTLRLYEQNLASKGELDNAKGQYDAANAQAIAAKAQMGAIVAQLSQSRANVGFTKIYSPVDGIVISRTIDPGATVVASFQSPTLFVIAQDLRKMRVMADVDEADVGRLKEGMAADAVVDAFTGEVFRGIVSQVRFSPNTVSGVVTYSAVVDVENPDEKLRPGMTATVTIRTKESKGVLRVPNSALRYKPTPPMGPNGKPVPQAPEAPLTKGQGRVYVLTNDKPGEEKAEARVIPIGITDGLFTEIGQGALTPAAKIVTDESDTDDKKKKGKLF